MTSLKAICTSLRKSSLFILFVFALLSPLSGANFRIAIISEDEAYQTLLEDVILSFDSISTDFAYQRASERIELENTIEYEKQLDKYLQAENFDAIGKLKKKDFSREPLDLELIFPELDESEKKFVLSADEDALFYIKLRDGYDMILTVSKSKEDSISELRISQDGTLIRECLFSSSLAEVEEEFLFDHFSSMFLSGDEKLLALNFPSNGTLYIDGESVNTHTSKLVLKKGEHDIYYIVPGYVSKKFETLVTDDSKSLNLNLELIDPTSLYISSIPYDADIFYNGLRLDDKYIDRLEYPFTISATADGYSLFSMQSLKPVDTLSITLKPKWMQDENLLQESKDEFYMNLFSTLICFGGYIAAGTVDNLMPNYDISPVTVVLGGISLVSLINMVDSMFEYFDSANYGI